jgi:ubiquinone/menaquinone biosynthesis C-methylase UbiE
MESTKAANQAQIDSWNGRAGERWVRLQETLDGHLEVFERALLARAAPAPGERVLDIGCGCGHTAIEVARLVGEGGAVLGLDVSGPMLARARERGAGLPQLGFEQADASRFVPPSPASLLVSRYGVMFFDDPARALANLHAMLAPGGRIAFVCWAPFADNPWMRVPFELSASVVPPSPSDPLAPGPFAFASQERVTALLEGAGFSAVNHERIESTVSLGATPEQAAAFCAQMGPSAVLLAEADEATKKRAVEALIKGFSAIAGPDGVRLGASSWLVTARA